MIRWESSLTYEKIQSTFTDLCPDVCGRIVFRCGPGKTRRPDAGGTGPIHRGERRDVRTVPHAAHREWRARQGTLVRGWSHAVESLLPIGVLDADRAAHCGAASGNGCRLHPAFDDRNLTDRPPSQS